MPFTGVLFDRRITSPGLKMRPFHRLAVGHAGDPDAGHFVELIGDRIGARYFANGNAPLGEPLFFAEISFEQRWSWR